MFTINPPKLIRKKLKYSTLNISIHKSYIYKHRKKFLINLLLTHIIRQKKNTINFIEEKNLWNEKYDPYGRENLLDNKNVVSESTLS